MEELVLLKEFSKYAYKWAEYYNDCELRNCHLLLAICSYDGANQIYHAIHTTKTINMNLLIDYLKDACKKHKNTNTLNKKIYFSEDLTKILLLLNPKKSKENDLLNVDVVEYVGTVLSNQTDVSYIFNELPQINRKSINKGVDDYYDGDVEEYTSEIIEIGAAIGNSAISLSNGKMPFFCKNLMGKENEIAFDRKELLHECYTTLARSFKKNIVLVGEAGVGKSKIVEIIANNITHKKCPKFLENRIIIQLNATAIMAGTNMRGDFENRIQALINFLLTNKNHILFVDEFHAITGEENHFGSEFLNAFKPHLANGEITMIAATTLSEFVKYVEQDKALIRRFEKIVVNEPTKIETLEILSNVASKIRDISNVNVNSSLLEHLYNIAKIVKPNLKNPDAAISVLDEFSAFYKLDNIKNEKALKSLQNDCDSIKQALHKISLYGNYDDAIVLKNEYKNILSELQDSGNLAIYIDKLEDVINWVNKKHKFEYCPKSANVNLVAQNLKEKLNSHILGQSDAINEIVSTIILSKHRVKNEKPLASILMSGNTGTGKTMCAKMLADIVFPTKNNLIKIDCSELSQSIDVGKLIGAAAGYVGYNEGGQLTNFVKSNPRSVILFDEIEKAHSSIYNLCLQMLNDGVLTDSKGDCVDFSNTIIIFTTNVGAEQQTKSISFGQGETKQFTKLEKHFKPEFLGRISKIVNFNPLSEETINAIIRQQIDIKMVEYNLTEIPLGGYENCINTLEPHIDKNLGVRNIQNAIEKYIISPIFLE